MLILTDGIKTIYGKKLTIGTGLNLSESEDGLPILHWGSVTGVPTGNSTATSHRAVVLNATAGAGLRLPELPSAFTIWEPRQRIIYNVSPFTEVRNVVQVDDPANVGSGFDAEFSLDGINWGPVSVDAIAAPLDQVGVWTGGWGRLKSNCVGDAYFRWGTGGGDGVSAPRLGNAGLEFRYGAPRSSRSLLLGGTTCYATTSAWDADWTKYSESGAGIGIQSVSDTGDCVASVQFDAGGLGGDVWYEKEFGGFDPGALVSVTASVSKGGGYDLSWMDCFAALGDVGETRAGSGQPMSTVFPVDVTVRTSATGTIKVHIGAWNLGAIPNGSVTVRNLQFWTEA